MKSLQILLPLLTAGVSSAATLSVISAPATPTSSIGSVTLPTGTGTDFGFWTGTSPVPGAATSTSNNGTQTFTVTTVNGGATRGSSTGAATNFTFSNASPAPNSGSGSQFGGVFNNQIGSPGVNSGIQMTLTSISAPVQISLYTYAFSATGTLNVYLDGSSTASYTSSVSDALSAKPGFLFSFGYTPTTATDSIRFEYIMSSVAANASGTSSGNVGFLATSIAPIPEASSMALLGAAASFGLLRRRRR
jgi:hypothetical protein